MKYVYTALQLMIKNLCWIVNKDINSLGVFCLRLQNTHTNTHMVTNCTMSLEKQTRLAKINVHWAIGSKRVKLLAESEMEFV